MTARVELPQHADQLEGDFIGLDDDGMFEIGGYDGMTKLTPAQAREVALMLLKWANRVEEAKP